MVWGLGTLKCFFDMTGDLAASFKLVQITEEKSASLRTIPSHCEFSFFFFCTGAAVLWFRLQGFFGIGGVEA